MAQNQTSTTFLSLSRVSVLTFQQALVVLKESQGQGNALGHLKHQTVDISATTDTVSLADGGESIAATLSSSDTLTLAELEISIGLTDGDTATVVDAGESIAGTLSDSDTLTLTESESVDTGTTPTPPVVVTSGPGGSHSHGIRYSAEAIQNLLAVEVQEVVALEEEEILLLV